jgi:hypothetical protein
MPPRYPSLAELLGADLPGSVRELPPAAQQRLADLVAAARAEQTRSLAAAFDDALRRLPFPLRLLVSRVLAP